MKKSLILIAFAVPVHFFGYYALLSRIEPYQYYFYLTAWWSYIVFIDALLAFKEKRFLIINRRLPALICFSCAFWCVFEVINVLTQNWFYINLPGDVFRRYGGYLLAFGTVVPAIYATKELICRLLGRVRVRPIHILHYPVYAISAGLVTLFVTYLFPSYCFPFTWIFLAFILDGYNYMKGYPSFMRELEKGEAGNLTAALASGLVCGALWETWNFWNIAKWVYTVPFFENLKLFEMPIPGYIGFLAFGFETMTLVNLLEGLKVYERRSYPVMAGALVFSFLAFSMIDRCTVFSYTPILEDLTFIEPGKLHSLEEKGIETSYGIDPRILDDQERASLALVHLKGLGITKFERLQEHGIESIYDLSLLDENTLSRIICESNPRRLRVYLRAAR
jgi:hypothetical protein